MKKSRIQTLIGSIITLMAPSAIGASDLNWNDQITAVKLDAHVRLIAYEHGQFEGARLVLNGSEQVPTLLQMADGQNWNDRISSLRLIDLREGGHDEALQAHFYQNASYEGAAFSLEVGTEIADLATWEPQVDHVAMTVHEWGTFTVLQGSDGGNIKWYQQPKDLVDLPDFVRTLGGLGKSGLPIGSGSGLDLVRMETPVLYFYPEEDDEALDITVSASFKGGRITEVFPPAYHANPGQTVWQGTLLPPDSPEREQIPTAKGPRGRHYAAARAVPDAWLFRGQEHPNMLKTYTKLRAVDPSHPLLLGKNVQPIEPFIFYRGAGTPSHFGIRARQDSKDPSKYTLSNFHEAVIPKLFALRVHDGMSSWLALTDLAKATYDREVKGMVNEQTFVFPPPTESVSEGAEQLRSAMVTTLADEGLTKQEAAAMVATWDNLWFTEAGTRVLAILPQSFADDMVPLEIAPMPSAIDRVFVARIELINRDQEAALMAVLNAPNADPESLSVDAKRLRDIQLGRYSAGGLERAMELTTKQMRRRFYALDDVKPDEPSPSLTSTRLTAER